MCTSAHNNDDNDDDHRQVTMIMNEDGNRMTNDGGYDIPSEHLGTTSKEIGAPSQFHTNALRKSQKSGESQKMFLFVVRNSIGPPDLKDHQDLHIKELATGVMCDTDRTGIFPLG